MKDLSFLRSGDEDAPQSQERLGQASRARPEGCLLWLHARQAAEAGPVLAVAQELSRLRGEPVHCLVTTESEARLVPKLDAAVIHQLAPVETAGSIARFLAHWSPDLVIEMGVTERTRLFAEVAARGLPMFHVSPSRTVSGRRRYPEYLKEFRTILAVSATESQAVTRQFEGAGVAVEITGPLSDTTHALPCNEAECDVLARLLGGRPVWLAAKALAGEVEMIEEAHRRAFRAAHRMLLILVPANLEDAESMQHYFDKKGWQTGLRSKGDEPDPDIQVYVADTEEELGLWYRLAPTSLVGGTLAEGGIPADPFDSAALGSAVLHGPIRGHAPARFERLRDAGASLAVGDGAELGEAILSLLAPDKAAILAQAGWAVTTESAHVVERLAEVMDLALDESEGIR